VTPEQPLPRPRRLVVTRPAAEADAWVKDLQARGHEALALPLIGIGPPVDAALQMALAHWRSHWSSQQALMFVSGAAVTHFFSTPPVAAAGTTRFWAPGPGTAAALLRCGLPAGRIDAPPADALQFDSEALWAVVASQVRPGWRILVVRGASPEAEPAEAPAGQPGQGRYWLIRQCEATGATVQACVAYERRVPVWDAATRALALAAVRDGSVWLFSSSQALEHLLALLPGTDWSRTPALATHPRIAAAAQAAGFGSVRQTRPGLADAMRALESA
jgi:uroporphyrinogen-III synthase